MLGISAGVAELDSDCVLMCRNHIVFRSPTCRGVNIEYYDIHISWGIYNILINVSSHLGSQILQRQVRLGLSQLGGRQLLLEAGDAVLGHVLSLGLNLLMLS